MALDAGEEGMEVSCETDDVWHMDWTALPIAAEPPAGRSPSRSSASSTVGRGSTRELAPRLAAGPFCNTAVGLQQEPNLVPSVADELQRELRSLCGSCSLAVELEALGTDRESRPEDELSKASSYVDKENLLLFEILKAENSRVQVSDQAMFSGHDAIDNITRGTMRLHSPWQTDCSLAMQMAEGINASCPPKEHRHSQSYACGSIVQQQDGTKPASYFNALLVEPTPEVKVDVLRLQRQACKPDKESSTAAARWMESDARAMRCRRHLRLARTAGTASRRPSLAPVAPAPAQPPVSSSAARPTSRMRPATPSPARERAAQVSRVARPSQRARMQSGPPRLAVSRPRDEDCLARQRPASAGAVVSDSSRARSTDRCGHSRGPAVRERGFTPMPFRP